jgi:drug/metabolite transporter (DMT)-like permease
MTLFGIGVVIFERTGNHADRFNLRIGVLAGVVAAVCQSIGVVITRDVFIEENTRPLLDASMFAMWTALLRILAGAILLLPLIPLFNLLFPHRKQSLVTKGVSSRNLWKLLVYATILGTYLGIFLQQFALQTTTVALAQTLFAFSSIWALGFDWFGPKKPGRRSFIGAAIAIGGIAVVLTSG